MQITEEDRAIVRRYVDDGRCCCCGGPEEDVGGCGHRFCAVCLGRDHDQDCIACEMDG